MLSAYKLVLAAESTTCKNCVSVICFTVTGFKLGMYSCDDGSVMLKHVRVK